MYGRLINTQVDTFNKILKDKIEHKDKSSYEVTDTNDWGVSEVYIHDKYKNVITRAKSYNIWSFE